MTNTEQIMPAMAQNMPSFNNEIDKQDNAANEPKINAKTVSTLPKLIYLVAKISVATMGVALTSPASFIFCK